MHYSKARNRLKGRIWCASTLDISASDESSPNSSTSPSLAQLGIAEFLPGPSSHHQHPSHSQAQQPSSGSSSDNNSSTMWEDITSSITKLDPDCADALQLMAPAVSATPGMGTYAIISDSHLSIGTSDRQKCTQFIASRPELKNKIGTSPFLSKSINK